jgi:hypothetical protein
MLRENILIYELLKFPYIQRKMLQSLAENSSNKKKYSLDKRTIEISSNKKKDVPDKSISNMDKIPMDTTIKIRNHEILLPHHERGLMCHCFF